jgi:hypothetical protein
MDVADDADGRVAIFSVEVHPQPAPSGGSPPLHRGPFRVATDHVGGWLDGAYAGVAMAVVLVVILVLGLALSRH